MEKIRIRDKHPGSAHTGGMQSNLLNGDPQVFLNVRQVLGLVVPHAAALTAKDYYQKYKKTDKKSEDYFFCHS
jgi:hypothetical protein